MGLPLLEKPSLRRLLLLSGALLGFALALAEIVTLVPGHMPTRGSLPPGVVARVGSTDIPMRRYQELLSDLESGRRGPVTGVERRFALQRLIDEQLLIDRARELRLDASVPEVRKAMASAVMAQVASEASAAMPDAEELRAFYKLERDFFTQPARYSVRLYRIVDLEIDDIETANRIGLALRQSSGALGPAIEGFQLDQMREIPLDPMPASTLSNYIGESMTAAVEEMSAGSYSVPMPLSGAWHIVHLNARAPAAVASFEAIEPVLTAELTRRRSDTALQDYLKWLASRAEVMIDPGFE